MPINKNAHNRYVVLDECLRNRGRRWAITDLQAAVEAEYNRTTATKDSVSIRTIKGDLHEMRPGGSTHFDAPICYHRDKGYYYDDPAYSIHNLPLSAADVGLLHQSLQPLRALRGLGLAADLDEMIQRLEQRLPRAGTVTTPILHFDAAPDYVGTPNLQPLYEAIRQRTPLELLYQPYRAQQPRPEVVHPYVLKVYNARWFLLALPEAVPTQVRTYPLERIVSLGRSPLPFRPATVDFNRYFQAVVGVTIPENSRPEIIRLLVRPGRAPYVRTKALHASQRTLSDTAVGLELELRLHLNQELKTLLLSFGPDVQVLAPASLRLAMQKLLQKAVARYEA